jgi:hypothetical protein
VRHAQASSVRRPWQTLMRISPVTRLTGRPGKPPAPVFTAGEERERPKEKPPPPSQRPRRPTHPAPPEFGHGKTRPIIHRRRVDLAIGRFVHGLRSLSAPSDTVSRRPGRELRDD